MSESSTGGGTGGGADHHAIPAGWHPDPAGSGMQRWWDGTRWTDHRQWPSAPPVQGAGPSDPNPQVAPGTPVYTPWIWLIVLLPLVSYALLPWVLGETTSQIEQIDTYGTTSTARFGMGYGVASVVSQLLGWLIWAVTVLFAWLDHRTLRARGFVRPFHWAFAFIPAPVYAIGRSIVVHRRSGRGIAPMWVTIGMLVLGLVVGIIAVAVTFSAIPWNELTPTYPRS